MLKKKQTKAPAFQPTQSKSIAKSAKSELARLRKQIKVEAALERVRARAMAMRKSEQLTQVAKVMLIQLHRLGISDMECSINIVDSKSKNFISYGANIINKGDKVTEQLPILNLDDYNFLRAVTRKLETGQSNSSLEMKGPMLNEMLALWKGLKLAGLKNKRIQKRPKKLFLSWARIENLSTISVLSSEKLLDDQKSVLKRMADTFSIAYTRFIDLQKAEAQIREAQIEAALERVRSKAMAMHKSDDVGNASLSIFDQLNELGISAQRCGIAIPVNEDVMEFWAATVDDDGNPTLVIGRENFDLHPALRKAYRAWEAKEETSTHILKGKDLVNYYRSVKKTMPLPDWQEKMHAAKKGVEFFYTFPFTDGWLYIFDSSALSAAQINLIIRFSKVFDLTYRRFQDLQKAETQAREAQIEAALERVRASTMAMHRSEDVANATHILFDEIEKLGIESLACGLNIIHESRYMETWSSTKRDKKVFQISGRMKMEGHPSMDKLYKDWKEKRKTSTHVLIGREVRKFYNTIYDQVEYRTPKLKKLPKKIFMNNFIIPEGSLWVFSFEEIDKENAAILGRFANVFSLTYRRYKDLQKAEAQAREAQIEAALERVRARSMAMHKSDELLDVITVVSEQLLELNFRFDHVSFANNDFNQDYKFWTAARAMPNPMRLSVPYVDIPMFSHLRDAQQQGLTFFTDLLTKQENKQWHKQLLKYSSDNLFSKEENEYIMSRGMARSIAIHPNIILILANYASVPYSEEENKIIARFGKVFEQSYTRFLDLQKAEAQAREAQIEVALERVRARSMAMHKSDELASVAKILYSEIIPFGINADRILLGFVNEEEHTCEFWMTEHLGGELQKRYSIDLGSNKPIRLHYAVWKKGEESVEVILRGKELQAYLHQVRKVQKIDVKLPRHTTQRIHTGFIFSYGWINVISSDILSTESKSILRRFAKVFEQTYTRFLDLQKAEAREQEAIKQSSLDRVRAEIASMRSSEDLNRITPLVWKELNTLGVPFFRCGVFIVDEPAEIVHLHLSTPTGEPLAALEISINRTDILLIPEMLGHWRSQTSYRSDWSKEEFVAFTKSMIELGQIKNPETYQRGREAPERLALHLAWFRQGMLYVGNTIPLSEDQMELVESLAEAFSVAYARYEDFVRLEEAKQKVENTLTDLRSAQSQLIQSEKMASLGELTAGIAHEIQNPLNFVNNFSEVSNELLVEMKGEIEKGNVEEVKVIAEDVIQNLEKILHHGKRADGIVKGMLQHSRSSSGQKESTNINALADEYLRLAYHGLRAKDKSFNAKFETRFDANIEKVNVVPQDIGRVILNLITNAFYVVTERKKISSVDYEPQVIVSTRKQNRQVEISVIDNGSGIPDSVIDKIFQPFFTTKPTGQGTGLGLSLSYDIVKAHGGEINIESKEGEGSTFTIKLPIV